MKQLYAFIFYLSLIILIPACCEDCEGGCPESEHIPLRVLSRIDSTDLIFGDSETYPIEELSFFNTEGTDSLFFKVEGRRYAGDIPSGVLKLFHEEFTASQVFIDFGNSDIDTLDITYDTVDCCGAPNRNLDKVFHNGDIIYGDEIGSIVVNIFK